MGLAAGALAVSAGTSLISGILNYMSVEKTNKQNYGIYKEQRSDTLAAQKAAETAAAKSFALQKKSELFSENQANLNRTENTEQKGYARLQSAYQRGADLWSQSMAAQQTAVAPLIRRA